MDKFVKNWNKNPLYGWVTKHEFIEYFKVSVYVCIIFILKDVSATIDDDNYFL
jgi:hypothetical protein